MYRKKIWRIEFFCDVDCVFCCICGDFFELEFVLGSNFVVSGYLFVRKLRGEDRVGESVDILCDCLDCIWYDRYFVGVL